MKLYKYFLLAATLTLSLGTSAQVSKKDSKQQATYSVSGKIIDADEGSPLEMVNIVFENNEFWAVTDLDGKFSLKLKNGEYHYQVSYVGYETAKGTLKVSGKDISGFNIKLKPSSLALSEVVVTAKQQAMGSSSVIDKTALQHLQPKSIEDMLQLTPGSVTQNNSLNDVGQAQIREIGGSSNNAMGAAIVLDGAPISNDATFMSFNTSKTGVSGISSQSTAGGGVDLRTISPDNVESIEVIRGIPSVEYGNLTSGAVIIKTKQGSTPFEVKGKTDKNSKMASVSKGFVLSTGTTVNLSADYSSSYSDVRFKAKGYERITGAAGMSQTFFSKRPLSVNAKLSYYQNLNTVRRDPQQRDSEKSQSDNKGIRFILNGDWNLKTALVSNLSYNFSLSYSHQRDEETKFMSLRSAVQPIGSSLVEGEHQAAYLKSNYYCDYYTDGKPVSVFAQLKATKTLFFSEDFTSAFKAGAEWAYDANKGEGLVFDPTQPPVINDVQTVRPRAYSDIPAMKTLSGFFENKTIVPIGTTLLTSQLGVRANYLFIDRNYLDRDNYLTVDPRFNLEYSILNKKNNSYIDDLSINGGLGVTSKTPSLTYLYPDKAYFDQVTFNHVDPFFAVLNTKIIQSTANVDLKPSVCNKLELGLSFQKNKVRGSLTFFHEDYSNEFGYKSVPMVQTFDKYQFSLPKGAQNIAYSSGHITYDLDGQHVDLDPISVSADSMFNTYYVPQNSSKTLKKGIEYTLDLGQIPYIRTSVSIDGTWLWIKRTSNTPSWREITSTTGKYYPYVAMYAAGSGTISQRINTNFRFITHIPEVKMIFTTTAQVVWKETEQSVYADNDGNNVWYVSEQIDGTPCLAYDPVEYMDYQGNIYKWDTKYRGKSYKNNEYEMIEQLALLDYYERVDYPGHIIFNFRMTKEFGSNFEVSFMANNLFNARKIYVNPASGGRTSLAIGQYFGAELKLKL